MPLTPTQVSSISSKYLNPHRVRRLESSEYGSYGLVQGVRHVDDRPADKTLGLFPGQAMPRLYDHLVGVLRVRHYSRRTEARRADER